MDTKGQNRMFIGAIFHKSVDYLEDLCPEFRYKLESLMIMQLYLRELYY
jgi:hypothetical protein